MDEIAEFADDVADEDIEAFIALTEIVSFDEAMEIFRSGDFSYIPDIDTEEELGRYVVDEGLFGSASRQNLRTILTMRP